MERPMHSGQRWGARRFSRLISQQGRRSSSKARTHSERVTARIASGMWLTFAGLLPLRFRGCGTGCGRAAAARETAIGTRKGQRRGRWPRDPFVYRSMGVGVARPVCRASQRDRQALNGL